MCCRELGVKYLKLVNGLTVLLGLVFVIVGAYAVAKNQEVEDLPGFDVDLSLYASVGTVVMGLLIIFISCLGYKGASNDNKCYLIIYIGVMAVMSILMIMAGAGYMVYINAFDDVAYGDSDAYKDEARVNANDAQLAMYQGCCQEVYNATVPVLPCEDLVLSECEAPCACVRIPKNYDIWLKAYNTETCDLAAKFTVNDHPLVGDPTKGGCGGGNPREFKKDVTDVLDKYAYPVGVATIIFALILVFATFFSLMVLCTKDKHHKQTEEGMERAANEVAGV